MIHLHTGGKARLEIRNSEFSPGPRELSFSKWVFRQSRYTMRILMEKNFTDSAAISIPPPIFFFVCLGCSLLLEYLFPISLINFLPVPRVIVGGIFIIIAICFSVSGFFMLIWKKTTFGTSKSTSKIVTTGVYRFSRNPLYFSLLLLLSGVAILLLSLWLFLAIPILYVLFLFKAVKPEEKYLLQKFGEEYLHYSEKVRRWI
jgi:protein-S-isoprenylcysteine O-methyltransferase Ste14